VSDDMPRFEDELRQAVLARLPQPDAGFEARLVATIARTGAQAPRQPRTSGPVALAATALALACVAILLIVRLEAALGHGHASTPAGQGPSRVASPSPAPSPTPTPDAGAAVVVGDPASPHHLERVDYAGNRLGTAWTLVIGKPGVQPTAPGEINGIGTVSPDGRYVTTLAFDGTGYSAVVMNLQGQRVSLPSFTEGRYAWADDSRHLCQFVAGTSGPPQLLIADITASPPVVRSLPITGLQGPEQARAARCSIAGDRALLVVGAVPTFPGPPTGDYAAALVRLSTGQVVSRVSMGNRSNALFSLDGRYMSVPDKTQGTSTIVDLSTGATVSVEHRDVVAFSADDSRVVENSLFELQGGGQGGVGQTFVVDWRTGQVLFARSGWDVGVRERPGSADLALTVELTNSASELGGPSDLVIVPAAGPPIVLSDLYGY
jgi:hypothetical protein